MSHIINYSLVKVLREIIYCLHKNVKLRLFLCLLSAYENYKFYFWNSSYFFNKGNTVSSHLTCNINNVERQEHNFFITPPYLKVMCALHHFLFCVRHEHAFRHIPLCSLLDKSAYSSVSTSLRLHRSLI